MNKRQNNVAASPLSRLRGNAFACMDRLPPSVRRALHEAVVDWCTLEMRWRLNRLLKSGATPKEAEDWIVNFIRQADAEELSRFAHRWPKRFGTYPHVAASGTPVRYDEARRR
jgi:hypothetical protein